jgi:hypothetical protein
MGSPNPFCSGCEAHRGDSEFIILEVTHLGLGHWVLSYATLSAHWGAMGDGTSRYAWSALQFPDTLQARPRIWVAEDKHANYRSQSVCDAGAYYTDTCDRNSDNTGWGNSIEPTSSLGPWSPYVMRNLGNSGVMVFVAGPVSRHLLDCTTSSQAYPGTECFWTGATFYGWQPPDDDGSTPYSTSMVYFGF